MTDITEAAAPLIQFYDSASYTFPPGAQYVMTYADGPFKGPADIYDQYPHVHSITYEGGAAASRALLADFEPGTNCFDIPGRLKGWCERRVANGHRAIVYADRFDLHLAFAALGKSLSQDPLVLWWIPTLDGQVWTAAGLAADIARFWGVVIPAGKVWANQYGQVLSGATDVSRLYGTW